MEADGFIFVSKKKRGKKSKYPKNGSEYITRHQIKSVAAADPYEDSVSRGDDMKRIHATRETLMSSDYYRGFKDVLKLISRTEHVRKCTTDNGESGQQVNCSSTDTEPCSAGELVGGDVSPDHCEAGLEETATRTGLRRKDSDDEERNTENQDSDVSQLCSGLQNTTIRRDEGGSPNDLHHERVSEVKGHAGNAVPGQWVRVQSVVCYGLGNFLDCKSARYQLALLILLCEFLKICPLHCHLFDPMFSTAEKGILAHLGFDVMQDNEEAKREVKHPTLFYMLHCCTPLYNNLLWANWCAESLANVVIIGNSFNSFHERMCSKTLQKEEFRFINHILPHTVEIPIKDVFHEKHMFNDTSLHVFPTHSLRTVPTAFWEKGDEPQYDTGE